MVISQSQRTSTSSMSSSSKDGIKQHLHMCLWVLLLTYFCSFKIITLQDTDMSNLGFILPGNLPTLQSLYKHNSGTCTAFLIRVADEAWLLLAIRDLLFRADMDGMLPLSGRRLLGRETCKYFPSAKVGRRIHGSPVQTRHRIILDHCKI